MVFVALLYLVRGRPPAQIYHEEWEERLAGGMLRAETLSPVISQAEAADQEKSKPEPPFQCRDFCLRERRVVASHGFGIEFRGDGKGRLDVFVPERQVGWELEFVCVHDVRKSAL